MVQTRAGTLISRQRRQPHPGEQLRRLLVDLRGPVMRGGGAQVSSFDVRHPPSLRRCAGFSKRLLPTARGERWLLYEEAGSADERSSAD